MAMTVWVFVVILAVFSVLTGMLIWKLLRDRNVLKSALFGIELTILGSAIVMKNDNENLFVLVIGYTLIVTGAILNIFALLKPYN